MRKYYLHDGTSEQGPFSLEELKTKSLSADTSIWYEGLNSWTTANQVDELKPLLQLKPPPLKSEAVPITAREEYQETKKSVKGKAIWSGAIVLTIIIIGVLVYNNIESNKALSSLQNSVSQKEIEEAEENSRKSDMRKTWNDFIKLERGDYETHAFGGISGLDLTISNVTGYALDEVEVEVDYVKESGGVYKTETVVFKNLPSNTKQTKYAPESSRGTSVEVRIKAVTAHSFNFCYNMYRTGVGGDDPWKCQ